LGGSWFAFSLGKKLVRPHLNKLGIVADTCHPNYSGGRNRRSEDQAGLGINTRLFKK
jgi:hypothetical protein